MSEIISIVDYGMGNIRSIQNMLKKVGHSSQVVTTAEQIKESKKFILPGVGSFSAALKKLHEHDLFEAIKSKVNDEKTPILGICLGMHLLAESSEESTDGAKGFGFIKGGVVKRFQFTEKDKALKVPHMGWNFVNVLKESALFKNANEEQRFYFIHSYYFNVENKDDGLCETLYGSPFISAVEKGHVVGVQFHPEKSHTYGMNVLKNFAENY